MSFQNHLKLLAWKGYNKQLWTIAQPEVADFDRLWNTPITTCSMLLSNCMASPGENSSGINAWERPSHRCAFSFHCFTKR